MGKRRKQAPWQIKKRPKKPKSIKPDRYARFGPLEITQFGNLIVQHNTMSPEQFLVLQERLVDQYPQICDEIDQAVTRIAEIVSASSPSEIMKRSFWQMASKHLKIESEFDVGFEEGHAMRMIDYVQSVIASTTPSETQEKDITEEQWRELSELVDGLFSRMLLNFQVSRYAHSKKEGTNNSQTFEEYKFKAQMYWCNVRGHRYLNHSLAFFKDVLLPHQNVLRELFGITVEQMLIALKNLQESLTRGLMRTMEDFTDFQQVTTEKINERLESEREQSILELPALLSEVVRENNWHNWQEDVLGRLLGLNLFDLQKVTDLPISFLENLAWAPGQEKNFFAEGEFRGWPLRVWPIFKRPFLKIDDHYYCFDLYSLNDNFYRVIQRIIWHKNPEYKDEWNKKQKEVSEKIPFKLFNKLLPGCTTFHGVYYKWHTDAGTQKAWCESDGLIIYEDHLFILEIKAGAFTHEPPATDFDSYIESLRNLVLKPTKQGLRFSEYLKSATEVRLFDNHHNEIGKISKKHFSHVTICAITLDSFTELASQFNQLNNLGLKIDDSPIWSLSIDDLRVYSEIFLNPLIFLHFVEQRIRAARSKTIRTEDEFDHLGLYLKHNAYVRYAESQNTQDPIAWHGYRVDIDKFFYERLIDPEAKTELHQKMPLRFREVIEKLSEQQKPGRRKVASFLLDCSREGREDIVAGITEILEMQQWSRRVRPISLYGDIKLTVFCWQDGIIERNEELVKEHVREVMIPANEIERLSLELFYTSSGELYNVCWEYPDLSQLSPESLGRLKIKAELLKKKRLEQILREQGKIGRNDLCPCGSGKKYKKCCSP